jgi:hypothetical protein
MKILFSMFAVILVFGLLVAAAPSGAKSGVTISLSGSEVSPKKAGDMNLSAEASGAMPGSFSITIEHSNGNITGGEWRFSVIRENAQGEPSETGTLSGTVESGTLVFSNGSVSAINNVQLRVTGKTGECGNLSGSGNLSGTIDKASTPAFSGSLSF